MPGCIRSIVSQACVHTYYIRTLYMCVMYGQKMCASVTLYYVCDTVVTLATELFFTAVMSVQWVRINIQYNNVTSNKYVLCIITRYGMHMHM